VESKNMKKQVVAQSFTPEHNDYRKLVASIHDLVDKARYHVFTVAASSQVQLYWTIGENIVQLQEKNGWGDAVVETLASDLKNRFPEAISFSARNLWLMRQLYTEYRDLTRKLKQAASELSKLKQLVSEIPWGQNILIIQKTTNIDQRRYYLKATREMGWSRNVLLNQIKGNAYQRHITEPKQHNFEKALSESLKGSLPNPAQIKLKLMKEFKRQ
jgi:predicted nuclease of restriction endonuclease-like (RecB) superfamily